MVSTSRFQPGCTLSPGRLLPLLVGSLLLLAGCASEQEQSETAVDAAGNPALNYETTAEASGRATYEQYCASCHGAEGQGNGPVASVLTVAPADLTQLRIRHGGSFPTDSIYAYIDGRADVQAHGTRQMPVWGNIWGESETAPASEQEVDLRIRELVEYIRSMQEPEAAEAM